MHNQILYGYLCATEGQNILKNGKIGLIEVVANFHQVCNKYNELLWPGRRGNVARASSADFLPSNLGLDCACYSWSQVYSQPHTRDTLRSLLWPYFSTPGWQQCHGEETWSYFGVVNSKTLNKVVQKIPDSHGDRSQHATLYLMC